MTVPDDKPHTEEELKLISDMMQIANKANKLSQTVSTFAGCIRNGDTTEYAINTALLTHVPAAVTSEMVDVWVTSEMVDVWVAGLEITAKTYYNTGQLRQRLQDDLLDIIKALK